MRYFHYSLVALLLVGCVTPRYVKREAPELDDCGRRIRPQSLASNWYNASVDVMGRHFSGLLLIKNIRENEQRVVFTNEAGLTFFDFEFSDDEFVVHTVVSQFDRRAVIRTLHMDLGLLLAVPFRTDRFISYESADKRYFAVEEKNETAYFITSKDCASLQGLELGNKRRATVSITFPGSSYPAPDTIFLKHYTFDLQVKLVRIMK
jgi:hypothetical protein